MFIRPNGLWVGRVELPRMDGRRRYRAVTHMTFCGMLKKFTAVDNPGFNEASARARSDGSSYALRRARLHAARERGTHTTWDWFHKLKAQDSCCYYCRRKAWLVKEHMTPLVRGGSDAIENIVGACKRCNSRKGAMTAAEFIRSEFVRPRLSVAAK